jgi:predicted dehydrogenase
MNTTVTWGILGCGRIARKFAASLAAVPEARLAAVAARSPGKAAAFAAELKDVAACDSYESLLADPAIQAVYVANTHNFHHDTIMLALEAGKHVLCEKPFALNARQARACIDQARAKGLFMMEGMWTRFLPAVAQVREWLAEGRIGRVQQIYAGFGFGFGKEFPADGRLLNPALAGGALLDVGIYPLSFASMIAGGTKPLSIKSEATLGTTGVDLDGTYLLRYEDDVTAVLCTSFTTGLDNRARVMGRAGEIILPATFIGATEVQLCGVDEDLTRRFPCPAQETFKYEISHVCECLRQGRTESEVMPLAETLLLAETMDALRAQWGLHYPGE